MQFLLITVPPFEILVGNGQKPLSPEFCISTPLRFLLLQNRDILLLDIKCPEAEV